MRFLAKQGNLIDIRMFSANSKKDKMFIFDRKFRRLFIFIVIGIIAISCREHTTNPNFILNSKDIKIKISNYGCLGGSKQIISIKEVNNERILTNTYIEWVYEPERKIKFDSKKQQILLNLIQVGQLLKDSMYCTGFSIYKIETERYKCEFKVNSCRLDKYLTELIK